MAQEAAPRQASTALKQLTLKVVRTKTRMPQAFGTFVEVLNMVIYGLCMGWAFTGMISWRLCMCCLSCSP